jgi:ATP-binding cassette subfamily F protein 3
MIKQSERFIERFKAKASKSRQVQSRVKMLDRIDMIEDVVDATARVNFKFSFSTQSGRHVADFEHVSKSYGDLTILKNTTAKIERGDKIALIGANGKGKSTLLRIINGSEVIEGERKLGHNVNMSLFAQHQLESLNVNNSMLEELKQAGTAKTEMELRGILGCFLFSSDDVFKKIKVLSGGEKSRVALAKTLISESNFLLLDEPTNHLDMVSVNILIQALQQYEGTFVVVSHDRFFVANIANKIWYIEDQEIKQYPGTYDEYEYWQEQRVKDPKEAPTAKQVAKPKLTDSQKEEQGKQLRKIKLEVLDLEKAIAKAEQEIADLETELANPEIYQDPVKSGKAQKSISQKNKDLEQLMENWEKLMAKTSELESA